MPSTCLLWMRRDLRLHDHPALHRARAEFDVVVPVFVLDDALLHGRYASTPRARFLFGCLRALDGQQEWPFTATKEDAAQTPRFKVTLGVVPDYLYQDKGMRIDGVTADRPAARAGLQRGDVVVRIDTIAVVDMQSYMQALSVFEAGQSSEVTVLRGGTSLQVRVIWD